jgi:hypothetical protein
MHTMKDHTPVVVPQGFKVTMCPSRVAQGARRAKGGAIVGSSSPKWSAMSAADRSGLRVYAALRGV